MIEFFFYFWIQFHYFSFLFFCFSSLNIFPYVRKKILTAARASRLVICFQQCTLLVTIQYIIIKYYQVSQIIIHWSRKEDKWSIDLLTANDGNFCGSSWVKFYMFVVFLDFHVFFGIKFYFLLLFSCHCHDALSKYRPVKIIKSTKRENWLLDAMYGRKKNMSSEFR